MMGVRKAGIPSYLHFFFGLNRETEMAVLEPTD